MWEVGRADGGVCGGKVGDGGQWLRFKTGEGGRER